MPEIPDKTARNSVFESAMDRYPWMLRITERSIAPNPVSSETL